MKLFGKNSENYKLSSYHHKLNKEERKRQFMCFILLIHIKDILIHTPTLLKGKNSAKYSVSPLPSCCSLTGYIVWSYGRMSLHDVRKR